MALGRVKPALGRVKPRKGNHVEIYRQQLKDSVKTLHEKNQHILELLEIIKFKNQEIVRLEKKYLEESNWLFDQ